MASGTTGRGTTRSSRQTTSSEEIRCRVAEGTQVHHGERLYHAGETVTVPAYVAEEWIARGYVEEAKTARKRT
jgi:hypothetical protein